MSYANQEAIFDDMIEKGFEIPAIREYFNENGLQPDVLNAKIEERRAGISQKFVDDSVRVLDPVSTPRQAFRGIEDVGEGIVQKGLWLSDLTPITSGAEDRFTDYTNAKEEAYQARLPEDEGVEWSRMAGAAAPFMMSPFKTSPHLGKAAMQSGAGGLAAGGLAYAPGGAGSFGDLMTTGISGVAGAAMPPAFRGLTEIAGKVINLVKNSFKAGIRGNPIDIDAAIDLVIRKEGIDPAELTAANKAQIRDGVDKALNEGSDLDAEALARKQVFDEMGFSGDKAPTTGQMTRNAKTLEEEDRLRNSLYGDDMAARSMNQRGQFQKIKNDMDDAIGGLGSDDIDASQQFFDKVDDIWRSTQEEVSKRYEEARKLAPNSTLKLENMQKQLDDMEMFGDNVSAEKAYNAGRAMIKNIGSSKGDLIDVDMNKVEAIRKKLLQRQRDATDPTERRFARKLVESLDADIDTAGDVFAEARGAASERFSKFEFDAAKKIIDQSMNENNFIATKVLGGRIKDVENMKELMLNNGGAQEWNNIKGRVFDNLMDKAFKGNSANAENKISGKILQKHLKKIGPTKLKTIFEPAEVDRLRKMALTGQWIESIAPEQRFNPSGTGGYMQRLIEESTNSGLISKVLGAPQKWNAEANLKAGVDAALSGQQSNIPNQAAKRAAIDAWKEPLRRSVEGRLYGIPPQISDYDR